MKNNNFFPASRSEDIVVQQLVDETLVYDLAKDRAICLNETSAAVWLQCDGTKSTAEISRELTAKLKSPVTEDFVLLALEQLRKENLLINEETLDSELSGLSRRELIKRVGLTTAIALPIISSLVAPSAANAQSCLDDGSPCTANSQCCSNFCYLNSCTILPR